MPGGDITHTWQEALGALLALAGWALAFTIFGAAMIYGALWITDAGKMVATREKLLGGWSGLREPRPVTNANELGIQTKQFNSQSKPRIKSGREAI